MTMAEKFYEYYIRTVTNAVRSARNSGVSIYAFVRIRAPTLLNLET
jgi:hypothetical protein